MNIGRSPEFLFQFFFHFDVCPAHNRNICGFRKLRSQKFEQFRNRPAAHTSAHQKNMIMILRDSEHMLCIRLFKPAQKCFPYRNSRNDNPVLRNTGRSQFRDQPCIRYEMIIKVIVGTARCIAVIGFHDSGPHGKMISADCLTQHQSGKYMYTDDGVVPLFLNLFPEFFGSEIDESPQRGFIPEDFMLFPCVVIASVKKTRRVTIHENMRKRDRIRQRARNECHTVTDINGVSLFRTLLFQRSCHRIVAAAVITAENQKFHRCCMVSNPAGFLRVPSSDIIAHPSAK